MEKKVTELACNGGNLNHQLAHRHISNNVPTSFLICGTASNIFSKWSNWEGNVSASFLLLLWYLLITGSRDWRRVWLNKSKTFSTWDFRETFLACSLHVIFIVEGAVNYNFLIASKCPHSGSEKGQGFSGVGNHVHFLLLLHSCAVWIASRNLWLKITVLDRSQRCWSPEPSITVTVMPRPQRTGQTSKSMPSGNSGLLREYASSSWLQRLWVSISQRGFSD